MDFDRVRVRRSLRRETLTKVPGDRVRRMDRGFSCLQMGAFMRASFRMDPSLERVKLFFKTETNTQEILSMD